MAATRKRARSEAAEWQFVSAAFHRAAGDFDPPCVRPHVFDAASAADHGRMRAYLRLFGFVVARVMDDGDVARLAAGLTEALAAVCPAAAGLPLRDFTRAHLPAPVAFGLPSSHGIAHADAAHRVRTHSGVRSMFRALLGVPRDALLASAPDAVSVVTGERHPTRRQLYSRRRWLHYDYALHRDAAAMRAGELLPGAELPVMQGFCYLTACTRREEHATRLVLVPGSHRWADALCRDLLARGARFADHWMPVPFDYPGAPAAADAAPRCDCPHSDLDVVRSGALPPRILADPAWCGGLGAEAGADGPPPAPPYPLPACRRAAPPAWDMYAQAIQLELRAGECVVFHRVAHQNLHAAEPARRGEALRLDERLAVRRLAVPVCMAPAALWGPRDGAQWSERVRRGAAFFVSGQAAMHWPAPCFRVGMPRAPPTRRLQVAAGRAHPLRMLAPSLKRPASQAELARLVRLSGSPPALAALLRGPPALRFDGGAPVRLTPDSLHLLPLDAAQQFCLEALLAMLTPLQLCMLGLEHEDALLQGPHPPSD